MMARNLIDDAVVVRTKNAGPFVLTYDVLFADNRTFDYWQQSGAFETDRIAAVLQRAEDEVTVIWYPPARAVKVVVPRPIAAGGWGDTDIFGCQQHAPLLEMSA